jgi:site-specific DNA recombinase
MGQLRAALYARISEDPLGLEKGVARQVEDGRALIAREGWILAEEFIDNNVSALRGKHRPGYEALVAAAEAGEFEVVVCFQQSRLWRNRVERAQGIERLRAAGVKVKCIRGSDLDFSTASGRMLVGVMGEVDTFESEVKSERVEAAALHRAAAGVANGPVAFGWQRVYRHDERGRVLDFEDVEHPERAAVVREIVGRLLAGEGLRAVATDLNARGVPTPRGSGQWLHTTVRKIALRPANVAQRVHRGEVIGRAAWPALVPVEQHEAVVRLLTEPQRRRLAPKILADHGRAQRRYLLTYGIGRCGVCGGVLRAACRRLTRKVAKAVSPENPDGKVVTEHELYICQGTAGCVGRNRPRVDELVREVIVARLSRPDALDLLRQPEQDDEQAVHWNEAQALRTRLDDAAVDYAAGLIDREQMRKITAVLRPRLEEVEARLSVRPLPDVPADALGMAEAADAGAVWDSLPVHRRRAVLDALCDVVLLPARKGAGFDPARVRFDWKA